MRFHRSTPTMLLAGALGCLAVLSLPAAAVPASHTLPALNGSGLDLTPGTGWFAGGDVESINPTQAMIDGGAFYLGGFGLGSGKTVASTVVPGAPTYDSGRTAQGILGDGTDGYGVHVRAMAVGDGRHSIVTAQIETQGYYIAYKSGNYGITDIRREAAEQIEAIRHGDSTAPAALPAAAIVVDSNHTHGGPDTAGVWGGVPDAYLQEVKDQSVKAIVTAWRAQRPVNLFYGTAVLGVEGAAYDGRYPPGFDRLMTNQYANDPNNVSVDDEMRSLQARDAVTGAPVVTYLNLSPHADVLNSNNRLVTGDYTGPLSDLLAGQGGIGFAQVATLGREQPARGTCEVNTDPKGCLDSYAHRVYVRAQQALANAQPVTGPKLVALSSYFLADAASNAAIVALEYGGFVAGTPLLRAQTSPWTNGDVIGTTAFSGRIGNILLSGNPGEPYPQILETVRGDVVHADGSSLQGYLSLGTAGDFLGYIIYPETAYPEPIRRTILSGDPPPAGDPKCTNGQPNPVGCPNPVGNDNFFFNISQTFGQRLVCSLLRGANAAFADEGRDYTTTETACAGFATDAALPAGYDTRFSSAGVTGPSHA